MSEATDTVPGPPDAALAPGGEQPHAVVAPGEEATPTVLGPGSHFEGLLTFRGGARVDGSLTGTIHANGRLEIGPQAFIRAQVEVDEIVIEGRVEGDIHAHRRAELRETAHVVGNLVSPRVSLALGSVLQGDCVMAPAPDPGTGARAPEPAQTPDSAAESA